MTAKTLFMARFPLDKHRCKEWVKITGNEDLAYIPIEKLPELKFVCRNHFENKDFNAKKTRLNRTAVPSIRLNAKPLSDEQIKEFPYTLFKEECAKNVPSISLVAASSQMNDTHIHHFQPEEGPLTSTAVTASLEKIYYECDIPSILCNIEVQTEEQRIIEKDAPSVAENNNCFVNELTYFTTDIIYKEAKILTRITVNTFTDSKSPLVDTKILYGEFVTAIEASSYRMSCCL